MKKNIILLKIVIFSCLFIFCDAPHDNPFDPSNPNRPFVKLTGIVETLSIPHNPISDATVCWDHNNIVVKTDINGKFTFNDLLSHVMDTYPIQRELRGRNQKYRIIRYN